MRTPEATEELLAWVNGDVEGGAPAHARTQAARLLAIQASSGRPDGG